MIHKSESYRTTGLQGLVFLPGSTNSSLAIRINPQDHINRLLKINSLSNARGSLVIIAHFRGLRFLAFSRRTLAAASDAFAAISLCFLGLRRFALAWPPLRPISDRDWETWSGSIRRTACAIHLIRAVESLCPQCRFSHSSQLLDGCLCSLRSRGQHPFRKTLLLPCWLPSSP